uniref:Chromo domain-containing protein n=1 Tax=Onchocerca volvulus TaxID=6282 RepID=A0A8R1XR81_ONCVO
MSGFVCWKGFPGQDTWEPLESIQHLDVFKVYAWKHNFAHLIPSSNDSSETESIENDERRKETEEGNDSETDDEKHPKKKFKILINSESEEENDKIINSNGNKRKYQHYDDDEVMPSRRINSKKRFRSKKEPKKDNSDIPRKSMRKYIEVTTDGFTATTKRTRSVSPIIDKILRKQQLYDVIDDEEFRDDQNFLKRTKVSAAVARSELVFVAKKLEEGCILRMFWMKIRNYNLRSPLRQIRKAKACELDYILFKIIRESKDFEKHYFRLRKCLIEQNAFEFLKQLQIIKEWCVSTADNFHAVVFGLFTSNENISKYVQILSNNCYAPKHNRCRIFEISLSCLSLEYRAKLFERLNHETKQQLLDIVIGIACISGGFCLLDILIKYGINISCTKINAIHQCVLNGNEEAALHLILNGFEVKRIKELPSNNLNEQTCKIMDSINIYLDRLNLKIQCWTMELLKEHSIYCTDAYPISNICLHRIGEIDRNICLIVSSNKSLSTTTFSSKKSHVLVMHSFNFSSAKNIMDIGIHKHHLPVQFHKHLQFQFGDQNDEMNLICVLHNTNSCIYWFPHGYNSRIGTRVYVKLSYLPKEYIGEKNDFVMLQLWDINFSSNTLDSHYKKLN